MTTGGGVARPRAAWRSVRGLRAARTLTRELGVALLLVVVYFGTRGLSEGSFDTAQRHAALVLRLEHRLGIACEEALQNTLLAHGHLVTLMNWVYIWGHWPVIVVVLVWLARRHPDQYRLTRDAMVLSGVIGLVVFAAFPVAPPRLMELSLVDTVTEKSDAYRVLQPPQFVNKYAAMPSLHVGWDLLIGLALVARASRVWLRALGVLMPLAMTAAVVLTANHYVLDAIAGIVLVTASLGIAKRRTDRAAALVADGPPVPGPDHPLAIAHRHGNLVDLLATAATADVDLVETDVHAYRRRLEVRHRKSLGPWLWDKWYVVRRTRPPLVLETLAAELPTGAELMVDIKGWQPWAGAWTARAMTRGAPGRPYTVCSRHWRTLRAIAEVPHARVVHSAGSRRQLRKLLREIDTLGGYGVSVHRRMLTPELVAGLRRHVAVVMTWPVNDPAALTEALAMGANGLISDDLDLLRRMIRDRQEVSP